MGRSADAARQLTPHEPGRGRRPHNDNDTPREARAAARNPFADDLVMALRFFSRLPTGTRPHERPELNRIAPALPFASVVIGLGPALLLLGASLLDLPKLFAAALAVGAAVLVGGAMPEDAIADAADGLFGGTTRERRLEIMKDSRHGTYGVSALCLLLILRVSALAHLAAIEPLAAAAIWLAATLLARSGALWVSVALPFARPDGISASAGRVTKPAFAMGGVFALILALILAGPMLGLVGYIVGVVFAAAVVVGWTLLCKRLVGGQTGDLIGAAQALIEVAALTGFLLLI